MQIRWRGTGGGVGTVDLRKLEGNQIVIHFGGALRSVDAYTFANSLVAFADTVRAVNHALNPQQGIEVRLEALAPGSFRAVVSRIPKGLGGFFSRGMESIFWMIIGGLIYDNLVRRDPGVSITVNTHEVIIRTEKDTVIVPREVYEQTQNLRSNPEVQQNLKRTFDVIQRDDAIDNFGITPHATDERPLIEVTRDEFQLLSSQSSVVEVASDQRRERIELARLVILKAWLISGNRKWSFEWNGVPISATISDTKFFERITAREILIGYGDALDVRLRYWQDYDEMLGVYINDPHTFEVIEVIRPVPKARQLEGL